MKYINQIIILIVFSALLSCNREDNYKEKILHVDPIEIQYFSKSSVLGQVLDQDFNPVEGCTVTFNDFNNKTQKTHTDENGVFNIKNKFLNETGQLLTFKKSNFFTQYAFIKPDRNQLSIASSVLQLKNDERKLYSNTKNKEYFYNNTIECEIPPNAIVDQDGNKHTGAFNLYCKSPFLQPNMICYPDFGIPFSNVGVNPDNNNTIVFPLFSTLIQIEDLNENQLYFRDSITVKVNKDNIPCLGSDRLVLWFFDTKTGKWQAQNELHTSGKIVEFKVINPGYYIITDKTDIILNIEGKLVYDNLSPAEYTYIEVIEPQTGLLLGQYFTDNFGSFNIYKEKNKDILLRIQKCDNTYYEYIIDENNEDIGEIILPEDFNLKYELTIDIPVQNGFLVFEENNGYEYSTKLSIPTTDSTQYVEFYGCDNEYVTLYNLDSIPFVLKSQQKQLSPGMDLNLNDLYPATEATDYLYISINNKQEQLFNINNYLYQDKDALTLESVSSKKITAIRFNISDSYCHFSYIKFIDKNDFEVLETDKDNPLDFEIISDTNHQLSGHFFGDINSNGKMSKVEGYFKITN